MVLIGAMSADLIADGYYEYNFETVECTSYMLWTGPVLCDDCVTLTGECQQVCYECYLMGGTSTEYNQCNNMCHTAFRACMGEPCVVK
jgi:hypothetical protein